MRHLGVIALALSSAAVANAGEVHTRHATGTWSSDPARGTLRGAIPNDGGYSFWLLGDPVRLDAPVTVIAQVRFVNRVDYGGAGVAIIDPNANSRAQKHLRIELSEREDTAGVGGWLGNENHFSGASKRLGKDIKVNEWYELALKVDGTKAIGLFDGQEVFNADVPELAQMPQQLTVAPFVVEADVEMRVTVRAGTPAPRPIETKPTETKPAAKIGWVEPYAKDETDGSDVKWLSSLPAPSLADDPKRGTQANLEWQASYELRGDRVCARIASLRAPHPSTHAISIGYQITLDGAIFDNGSRTKTIVVTKITGTPTQATAGVCEKVVIGGTPKDTKDPPPPPKPPVDDPYGDDAEPAPLPPNGRISDLLPAKSKKQADIEKLFAAKVAAAAGPDDYRKMYGKLDELILVVGKYHFLLEPISRQWHFYNRLHDTWEPTGHFAGDATFSVVRGKVKVTKKKPAKRGKT